jgi:hypothetical protein
MTVSQVIDLAGQEPVDAYEIPERHRTAVHLRTPADCFPFSSNTSRRVDVDHVKAHKPGGKAQSRMGNYGPLGRFNHRVKTHGHWTVKQPFDGVYVWRDPHGELYLVDHTGTRKITDGRQRRTDRRPARRPTHDDLSVDVYESDVCIDLGFEALH